MSNTRKEVEALLTQAQSLVFRAAVKGVNNKKIQEQIKQAHNILGEAITKLPMSEYEE